MGDMNTNLAIQQKNYFLLNVQRKNKKKKHKFKEEEEEDKSLFLPGEIVVKKCAVLSRPRDRRNAKGISSAFSREVIKEKKRKLGRMPHIKNTSNDRSYSKIKKALEKPKDLKQNADIYKSRLKTPTKPRVDSKVKDTKIQRLRPIKHKIATFHPVQIKEDPPQSPERLKQKSKPVFQPEEKYNVSVYKTKCN